MSVGHCYLLEALLDFFKMDYFDGPAKENNPCLTTSLDMNEKKSHALAIIDKFLEEYVFLSTASSSEGDEDDEDEPDGVLNYAVNLLRSFMLLLDCKDAVASGNEEHLALIQKQMLFHFSSVSGYNSYAIEMLVSIIQNDALLSPAEAHRCKWAALANWKGGGNRNIGIDLLQENRNKDIKELIHHMGANKTEKAILGVSKAAGGVCKIVDVFEAQASIKPKSSAYSHRSSIEDEKKIIDDLRKLKPFCQIPGRFHGSFEGVSSDPVADLNEAKFSEWLQRHQKNMTLYFMQMVILQTNIKNRSHICTSTYIKYYYTFI